MQADFVFQPINSERDVDRVADAFFFEPVSGLQLHAQFSQGTTEIEVLLSATGKQRCAQRGGSAVWLGGHRDGA